MYPYLIKEPVFLCDVEHGSLVLRHLWGCVSMRACCRVEAPPVSTPLLPVDKVFKQDAVGVALAADVHRLQDPSVTQLHHHPLLAEAECLPVVIRFDAAHKVWLTHDHLRQQVHQGVLHKHNNEGRSKRRHERAVISFHIIRVQRSDQICTGRSIQTFSRQSHNKLDGTHENESVWINKQIYPNRTQQCFQFQSKRHHELFRDLKKKQHCVILFAELLVSVMIMLKKKMQCNSKTN